MNLRIGSRLEVSPTDYERPAQITWKDFYGFRNEVLGVLRRFGTAGPMGEVNLSAQVQEDDGPEFDRLIVDDPDFFVVDDMYNEHDKLSLVECGPQNIKAELILSLSAMAANYPGWWVIFSMGDSGLRISADTLLLGGRRFWDCDTVEMVAERCAKPVDFGPVSSAPGAMYPLWLAVVSGEFTSVDEYAPAPDRQWREAVRSLEYDLRQRPGRSLSSYSYDAIRNDLHPEIRRQFLMRLLSEVGTFPSARLKQAKRNIQRDAGEAFSLCAGREAISELAGNLSKGQLAVIDKLEAKEVVFWWSYVLYSTHQRTDEVRGLLVDELRAKLDDQNPIIQLSAVFGLAHLEANDIVSVVDNAAKVNPHWMANTEMMKWLNMLKAGSKGYPSGQFLA
jgi:hypothetical protein